MRPGEFRARAALVAFCVAALVGLLGAGCERENLDACGRMCSPGRPLRFEYRDGRPMCVCPGGLQPDGGAAR